MPTVLVVGATRGLGYEVASHYARREDTVFGTARSGPPKEAHHDIHWISGIDISTENAGDTLVKGLQGHKADIVAVTAGYFPKESLDEPSQSHIRRSSLLLLPVLTLLGQNMHSVCISHRTGVVCARCRHTDEWLLSIRFRSRVADLQDLCHWPCLCCPCPAQGRFTEEWLQDHPCIIRSWIHWPET